MKFFELKVRRVDQPGIPRYVEWEFTWPRIPLSAERAGVLVTVVDERKLPDRDEAPLMLANFAADLKATLDKIPKEHAGAAEIVFETERADDDEPVPAPTYTIRYSRLETDVEFEQRMEWCAKYAAEQAYRTARAKALEDYRTARAKALEEQQERDLLARLRAKYDAP